jgi:cob(I)alamin adenosyltransferase
MKIYTKTGDEGMTSLYGGSRLPKNHIRIEAYGTVDELNAWIGLVRDKMDLKEAGILQQVQDRLFNLGAHLAAAPGKDMPVPDLTPEDTRILEEEMDHMTLHLKPLKFFILPGGHPEISEIHIARTICRRAERRVMALNLEEQVDPKILIYLNRLSDYLFVLSRWKAKQLGVEEIKWIPRH